MGILCLPVGLFAVVVVVVEDLVECGGGLKGHGRLCHLLHRFEGASEEGEGAHPHQGCCV